MVCCTIKKTAQSEERAAVWGSVCLHLCERFARRMYFDGIETLEHFCFQYIKCFASSGFHRFAWRHCYAVRVHLFAVFPEAIAEVRTCCQASTAYISNDLPLRNVCASANARREARHVQVLRFKNAVVANFHVVSVAAFVASFFDNPIAYGKNGRASGRGVVCAKVRLHAAKHRVEAAQVIARADARIFQRSFQEGFFEAVAFFVEEIARAVLLKCHSEKVLAHVVKLRCINALHANRFAINKFFIKNNFEEISFL